MLPPAPQAALISENVRAPPYGAHLSQGLTTCHSELLSHCFSLMDRKSAIKDVCFNHLQLHRKRV